VYAVDVPQVRNFTATFAYNFFTPDECINDTGGVPARALSRPGALIDSSFIQWSMTRVPREVDFKFSPPKIADVGNTVSALAQRNNSTRITGMQNGSLILDNIDKVVDEDFFSGNNFVAISFHDGDIGTKAFNIVSGTLAMQTLENEHNDNASSYHSAQRLNSSLPNSIKPHFVYRALTQPDKSGNAQFYSPTSAGRTSAPTTHPKSKKKRFVNGYFEGLKNVAVNTQVNSKLLEDMANNLAFDPTATLANEISNIHGYAKSAKQSSIKFSTQVCESDYKTFIPYIDVKRQKTALHHEKYGTEIVGFIIDKYEVLQDGSTIKMAPIVIDSPNVATTADFAVKFHANYCYTIRSIGLLTMPAIDDSNGDVATIKVLVSSKPSNKVYVSTTKLDAPPPPGDVDFIWNYETNKLTVTWAFPVWSQQDIKQFQVFRRSSVKQPFALQKNYNFDDSDVKFPDNEQPDPSLVEYLTSPAQYYVDDDFDWLTQTKEERGFIYSVSCVDAHGLSSCLSAQYVVWFDAFKNVLVKKHVSHLGAPKQYPNLYLDGELFVNTIKANGPSSTNVKLYFNPEYYYVYDDQNKVDQVVATKQKGGSYQLQFINVDNGKAATINITIDDQLPAGTQPLATTQVQLGRKRNNKAVQNGSA
jgi:hypothetical protein